MTGKWIPCANCGIMFGVPVDYDNERRADGDSFCCPNGHSLSYSSENEKVRRERDRLKQRLAQQEDETKHQRRLKEGAERQASAYKGQATKLRNRAKGGVCPCCNRTFQNLQRHMKSKHPKFGGSPTLDVVEGGKK